MAVRPVVTTASGTITSLAVGSRSSTIYTVPASTEARLMLISIDGLGSGDFIYICSNTYRAIQVPESALVDGVIDLDSAFWYFEAGDVLTIQNQSAGAITITYYISIIEQADSVEVEARGIAGTTALLAKGDDSAVLYTVPASTEARVLVCAVNDATANSARVTSLLVNGFWAAWNLDERGDGWGGVLFYLEVGDELSIHYVDPPGVEIYPDSTFHVYFSILERTV